LRKPYATIGLALTILATSLWGFWTWPHTLLRFGLNSTLVWKKFGIPLFTCIFFHSGWIHLFGNLFFLLIYAPPVESRSGWRSMLTIFFVSGISGSLLHSIAQPNLNQVATGSSAGVVGLMVYFTLLWPAQRWVFFVLAILIQIYSAYLSHLDLVQASIFGHAGGAISGICFWMLERRRV